MKILFNCLNLEKGGAERVISVLANNFSIENEVTILMLRKKEIKYNINNNIKLVAVSDISKQKNSKIKNIMNKMSVIKLSYMARKINEINPDVIISFLPEPSLKLMLLKKFNKKIRKIPTIVSIRNDPKKEYSNKIIFFAMKSLYKNVDKLVLQTNDAFDYFKDIINEKKLVIIPNPIDDKFLVRKPFDGERNLEIVTVGRLVPQKNHKLLIDAFKNVSLSYKDLKLLIYGTGFKEEELKEYVKKLNLMDKVIFKGQSDQIEKDIYRAKMFVLSSDYEGMPNALMEAMALGVPCISTDCPCGGPRMLINDKKNGLLIPVNDLDMMIKAIKYILANSKKAEEFSKCAIIDAKKYETTKICKLWQKEIDKIVN